MFQLDMQPLRSATKLDPCNIGILVYGIDIYIYIYILLTNLSAVTNDQQTQMIRK